MSMLKKTGTKSAVQEKEIKRVATDLEGPKRRLNVEIPASMHTNLKVKAAQNGEKITDIVIRALNDHLKK